MDVGQRKRACGIDSTSRGQSRKRGSLYQSSRRANQQRRIFTARKMPLPFSLGKARVCSGCERSVVSIVLNVVATFACKAPVTAAVPHASIDFADSKTAEGIFWHGHSRAGVSGPSGHRSDSVRGRCEQHDFVGTVRFSSAEKQQHNNLPGRIARIKVAVIID
jgi:hypothetical protein